MNANREKSVPFYTKAGWVAAWMVMLVFGALILRNCASSIFHGSRTANEEVAYYHSQGEKVGKAGLQTHPQDLDLENPVLRKAYSKGYRDGLDVYRSGAEPLP